MSTVSLESFFPDITIHVEGCAEPVMTHAVRNAAITFLSDTLMWRETLDQESVSASGFPYDLPSGPGGITASVLDVRLDGAALRPITELDLDKQQQDWRTQTGTPAWYWHPGPDTISVYPLPDAPVLLTLTVAYTLTRTATAVPAFLHMHYAPVIAAGALAQLFAMPNKPWSNPQAAAAWADRFGAWKADAKAKTLHSHSEARLSVDLRGHW